MIAMVGLTAIVEVATMAINGRTAGEGIREIETDDEKMDIMIPEVLPRDIIRHLHVTRLKLTTGQKSYDLPHSKITKDCVGTENLFAILYVPFTVAIFDLS